MTAIAVAHSVANANVRNAVQALADQGMLKEFWTCVAWDRRSSLNRLLPRRLTAQLQRRSFPDQVFRAIRTRPGLEALRLLSGSLRLGWLSARERGRFCIDAVNGDLDRRFARRLSRAEGVTGIYTYEDIAVASLGMARALGITGIYELPIGYWRAHKRMLLDEAEREPEWAATLPILADGPAKLAQKDRELALADHVVVPSSFVRDSLAGSPCPAGRVHVVPYGCPEPHAGERAWSASGPLSVLFVGGLSQRKGVSYLFRTLQRLEGRIRLTVIGRRGPGASCPALDRALAGVRHLPTLPHAEVLREMRAHDVLLFPSLFEGMSLSVLEALSQGLPVVTTPNSGASDVLTEGVDGFVVPIRDVDAMVARLELLAADRGRLRAMGQAALLTAGRCSWTAYRRDLVALLRGLEARR